MHPLYDKANSLSSSVIGAAMEVHTVMGAGLIESVYERCLLRELELRDIQAICQKNISIEYKGLVFENMLRFDLLAEGCLLIEVKSVEAILPVHKAQLLSYMKIMNIPVGLLINFHEVHLKNGVSRMILPGANLRVEQ